MVKSIAARLLVLSAVSGLAACSLAGPPEHTFVTTQPTLAAISAQPANKTGKKAKAKQEAKHEAKAAAHPDSKDTPEEAAMKSAETTCRNDARDKGIKSVLAIVTFMRPGAVDAAYIDCMKSKGYDVAK